MFERFTDPARRAVLAARREACQRAALGIGPEHVLLGLLHDRGSAGGRALASAGATLVEARASLGPSSSGAEQDVDRDLPFTAASKQLLEAALREALRRGDEQIGTEHLALALSRATDPTVARLLADLGVGSKALRARVEEQHRERPATARVIPRRGSTPRILSAQLSPRAQEMLTWSARRAVRLGVGYVGRRSATLRLLRHATDATRALRAHQSDPSGVVPARCSRCGTRSPECGPLFADPSGALACQRCTRGIAGSALPD